MVVHYMSSDQIGFYSEIAQLFPLFEKILRAGSSYCLFPAETTLLHLGYLPALDCLASASIQLIVLVNNCMEACICPFFGQVF
jgi:hypothetical protein